MSRIGSKSLNGGTVVAPHCRAQQHIKIPELSWHRLRWVIVGRPVEPQYTMLPNIVVFTQAKTQGSNIAAPHAEHIHRTHFAQCTTHEPRRTYTDM
jgi:hypothetical protein